MDYFVVEETVKNYFEDTVRHMLKQGWKLQGGVSTSVQGMSEPMFHQAMYRENENTETEKKI